MSTRIADIINDNQWHIFHFGGNISLGSGVDAHENPSQLRPDFGKVLRLIVAPGRRAVAKSSTQNPNNDRSVSSHEGWYTAILFPLQ